MSTRSPWPWRTTPSAPYLSVCAAILWLMMSGNLIGQERREYIIIDIEDRLSITSVYPFGGYIPYRWKGDVFSDVFAVALELVEREPSGHLRVVGAVLKKADTSPREFRFSSVKLDSKRLSFKTETLAGTRYEFEGQFTRSGDLRRFFRSRTPVLRGTLTRHSADKVVLSTDVEFSFIVWKGTPYFQKR